MGNYFSLLTFALILAAIGVTIVICMLTNRKKSKPSASEDSKSKRIEFNCMGIDHDESEFSKFKHIEPNYCECDHSKPAHCKFHIRTPYANAGVSSFFSFVLVFLMVNPDTAAPAAAILTASILARRPTKRPKISTPSAMKPKLPSLNWHMSGTCQF